MVGFTPRINNQSIVPLPFYKLVTPAICDGHKVPCMYQLVEEAWTAEQTNGTLKTRSNNGWSERETGNDGCKEQ